MEKGEGSSVRKVWRALFRSVAILRRSRYEEIPAEWRQRLRQITLNQLRMIEAVRELRRENPGTELSLKQLASYLLITPAAASEMVEAMVQKDLLCRRPSRIDRRSVDIDFTDAARKLDMVNEDFFDSIVVDFMADLTPEEQEIWLKLTGKFYDKVNQMFGRDGL